MPGQCDGNDEIGDEAGHPGHQELREVQVPLVKIERGVHQPLDEENPSQHAQNGHQMWSCEELARQRRSDPSRTP
jgi:hypothetical protein